MAVQDPTPNNVLVTSDLIAKEALLNLSNNLVFAKSLSQPYNYMFGGNNEYVPGDTINFKYEPRYEVRTGMKAEPQATVERKGSMTLNIMGLDLQFSGAEFSLRDVSVQRKIAIAGQKLAEEIDIAAYKFLMSNCNHYYNWTDFAKPTGGVEAVEFLVGAQARLSELATPVSGRTLITPPTMNAALVAAFSGMFNPTGKVSEQYNSGVLVNGLGFNSQMSQVIPNIEGIGGPATPVEIVSFQCAAGESVTKVVLKDALAAAVSQGALVQIDGCNFLNPSTLKKTDSAFTFRVMSMALAGSKDLLLTPVVTSGNYQQVSVPVSGSKLSSYLINGNEYRAGILLQKNAMVMGSVPFRATSRKNGSDGNGVTTSVKKMDGITLTVSSQWDYTYSVTKYRIDVLYGFAMQNPTSAVQLLMASNAFSARA